MRPLGNKAFVLTSVGSPLGGDQVVSSAVAAALPTFPIVTTVAVRAGDLLQVHVVVRGNASAGAATVYAQLYIGGAAVRELKGISVANAFGFLLPWTDVYTVTADNPALAVEVYCWKLDVNWTCNLQSGMQIVKLPKGRM